MKKALLFLVLIAFSASFAQNTNTETQKIGYVNSEVILAQYPAAIKAKGDLDALVAKWRKQADSMATEYQNAIADYQKQSGTMTPDKQKEWQQQIVGKEQKIQSFQQQKFGQPNGEYFTKQDELMTPVKQKIFDAIENVAKEEGLKFVFDKAGDVVLLYADAGADVTFKVLDKLKRGK